MGLQIYNTLAAEKQAFVPVHEGEARIYVCGVTVYDSCHVGHARALLTFDVVYRYLRFLGYRVTFVRNFTDLDDKIIDRARREGTTCEAIAARYIGEFNRDSEALGLLRPAHEPKATEHIDDIITLIRGLEGKGMAYRINGDVYFAVDRFTGYGKLSRKKLEDLEAGARVEIDERKRSPLDFALWKKSKGDEPFWESPWGKGRPGWHIECSAMSTRYLGQPFDIHGGGLDLLFPHHENEIAQSEGHSGVPLARFWMHNGFLNVNKEKMSKSLGNIFTIQQILEQFDAAALRHYVFASHYRSPLDFSHEGLQEAEKAVERIHNTVDRATRLPNPGVPVEGRSGLLDEFSKEMNDDFNTPRALALMFEEVRLINRLLDQGETREAATRAAHLKQAGEVLGLLREAPEAFRNRKNERWLRRQGLSAQDIEELIRRRNAARSDKRWDEADRIRSELKEKGVLLEDTPAGTAWKVG